MATYQLNTWKSCAVYGSRVKAYWPVHSAVRGSWASSSHSSSGPSCGSRVSRCRRPPPSLSAPRTSGIGVSSAPTAPNPTSARYGRGSPGTSTRSIMCVRGRLSGDPAPSTTRPASPDTVKPSASNASLSRVFCS